MKKPAAPAKKTAAKKPAAKPDKPERYDGRGLTKHTATAAAADDAEIFVKRFAWLADDRLAVAALARRFYPDLSPDAARVKLHAHLSATAKARSLDDAEEARLLALVEDFALFLMQKVQPKVWQPADGSIRSMDLIFADDSKRSVVAVDRPDGGGRFKVFIPAYIPRDGQSAHILSVDPAVPDKIHSSLDRPPQPPIENPEEVVKRMFGPPARPTLDESDFGTR